MNIVVCVKQVPDTWAERKLRPEDSTLDRDAVDGVINELDEYAIEEGLRLAEAQGGEVTILSMGPDKASESIRKALSMGADKAVHVVDDALDGSDALPPRRSWPRARRGSGSTWSSSARSPPTPGWACSPRCWPSGSACRSCRCASKVEIDGTAIRIHRQADYGYDKVEAALPAVVSVVEKINEPRYPSFKGIMAAKKKPVDTLSLADSGHRRRPGRAWPPRPPRWSASRRARPAQAGTIVKDEGDGGVKAAEFLAAQKFI